MIVTFVNEFNVLKPEEAKPNDDGTYEVKLNVPSLTDTMEGIQLWVYSKDGTKKFVVIDPVNIDKEGKTLTVNLNDGDFFMEIINNSESERSRQRWRLFFCRNLLHFFIDVVIIKHDVNLFVFKSSLCRV